MTAQGLPEDKREERLPTRDEIACDDGMDGSYAIKHFHGKTLAEAEAMFAEASRDYCSLTHTEDLDWMRPVGFRFYIRAAIRFALSERAAGDPNLINGLAGVMTWRLEHEPQELVPCAGLLAEFCRAVVAQFERYDAAPHIYVGLREQYEGLAETFENMTGG